MGVAVAVVVLLVILGVIVLASSVRILREYERGVIFRLGRLIAQKGPGLILGFITSRIEARRRSRRISLIAIKLRTRRRTSSKTSAPGSSTSRSVRAQGRAAATIRRSHGKTFSSHQRAISGNERRRSVSPVGAQSTTITSNSPEAWWRLIWRRLKSSSIPGGTVSSSAAMSMTPRSASSWPSQR